jgi:two-component system NtrC family sensor kinase
MTTKLTITGLLLITIWSFAFGQNQFRSQIDSVQNLIKANTNDDIEKVQQLNELARLYFYNQQIKEGFFATREALQLSEQIGFESGRVMFYLTLSAYHGIVDNEMRIYYRKKAEWLSKSFGSQSRNYFSNFETPPVDEGNDFEKIREKYLKILPLFDEEEDKEIKANLLLKINYFNFRLGEIEKVLEYFDRIDAIYDDLGQVYPKFLLASYRLMIYNDMGNKEAFKNAEAELLKLFLSSKDQNIIGLIASTIASSYSSNGRFLLSIEYYLKSIKEFEQTKDLEMLSILHHDIAVAYENLEMYSKAVESYKKSIDALIALNNTSNLSVVYGTIIFPLIAMGETDQAREYMALADQDSLSAFSYFIKARLQDANGQILMAQKKYEEAIPYFENALSTFKNIHQNHWGIKFMYLTMAECNANLGKYEQALTQAFVCLDYSDTTDTRVYKKAYLLISQIYESMGNESKSLKYLKSYQKIVEESDKLDELNRIADAEIKAIMEKSQREIIELEGQQELANQENKIQRLWLISVFGALLSALLVLYILYRNNRSKQKTNSALKKQKEKVEQTLIKLKSTQSQLIQAEKMASLGELTAGIAHEIQNPLNFVNNFAEVSEELAAELKDELNKGEVEEAKEISSDIINNLNKISQHGKRASFIVNGMLEHSRAGSGKKAPTDIKLLAEEFLKLAYHGLRAKDKSFQADFEIKSDEQLPKVNVVSQDIGRVLLNLITNAFYAVGKKAERAIENYRPKVLVEIKSHQKNLEIRVKDNGDGIPKNLKDKIFQPFFTTKPTGEGTGLGLSLSYDIVIKGHNGTLNVISTENIGTEIVISLPK